MVEFRVLDLIIQVVFILDGTIVWEASATIVDVMTASTAPRTRTRPGLKVT